MSDSPNYITSFLNPYNQIIFTDDKMHSINFAGSYSYSSNSPCPNTDQLNSSDDPHDFYSCLDYSIPPVFPDCERQLSTPSSTVFESLTPVNFSPSSGSGRSYLESHQFDVLNPSITTSASTFSEVYKNSSKNLQNSPEFEDNWASNFTYFSENQFLKHDSLDAFKEDPCLSSLEPPLPDSTSLLSVASGKLI